MFILRNFLEIMSFLMISMSFCSIVPSSLIRQWRPTGILCTVRYTPDAQSHLSLSVYDIIKDKKS